MAADTALEERLAAIVGSEHVLRDADLRAGYEADWTGRWSAPTRAVIRPGSTTEVAAVLRLCAEEGIAVVPQGGNTGLVGGGVPRRGLAPAAQIVLSTRRFTHLGPVDSRAMQVTVGAGVTVADWRSHARAAGLDAGLDFAARDSATVGGAIGTNAGGSRVLRFGTMRSQVVGIEAALSTGEIVGRLGGLPKETAGLHWPSVLAGSEGTLGVVTAARLRLVPRYLHTCTAMVALPSLGAAVELLARLRSGISSLDAVELLMPEALELVASHLRTPPPVDPSGAVVLVDCADHRDPSDDLLGVLADNSDVTDTAWASEGTRRQQLIGFRDRLTEAIAAEATRAGTPTFKLDVAVPVGRLPELLDTAGEVADDGCCRLLAFGHLAEGNVHLNFLGASDTERITDRVLGQVAEMGGTISAEHGIGVAKAAHLHLIRGSGDLAAQRRVKSALDPAGIMNPGVLGS
jgi:FAD/FMN-containing dehydrogenase